MLESLSSLLASLDALKIEKSQEGSTRTLGELIPSLLKIRQLAGMFSLNPKSLELVDQLWAFVQVCYET